MKGLKQRLKRPTATVGGNSDKDQSGTWTRQDQRVWQSVASNQPTKVAAKLNKHPDVKVNKICPNVGYSVVHYAAAKGLDDCLNILLAHRADASATDITGATPLHAAARYGHKGTTSKLLASRSVKVNLSDKNKCTALHFAAFEGHDECVELISEVQDADLQCVDKDGRTPLMVAAAMGHINVCKELLSRGSDVHHRDTALGHTALTLAADSGHAEVVRMLCDYGAQHSVALNDGRNAMNLAKQRDRRSVIDALHVIQLTDAAKKGPNGPRLSTSKYKPDEGTHKKRHSIDSLLEKQSQTFIDDLVAGTHPTSRTPKTPRRSKEEKKFSKSNIAKVKAAVEAKIKTNSRRGSNASGLSSASTPRQKMKKGAAVPSPGSNRMAIYADTNNSNFYDKEMKFYDTSLSNSSLDVSSTCSAALNNFSKSMDSLKPTPEELEDPVFEPHYVEAQKQTHRLQLTSKSRVRKDHSSGRSPNIKHAASDGTDFSSRQNAAEKQKFEKISSEYERKIQELQAQLAHANKVAIATEKLQKNAEEIRIAQIKGEQEEAEKSSKVMKQKVEELEKLLSNSEEQIRDMNDQLQAVQQVAVAKDALQGESDKYKETADNLHEENEKLKQKVENLEAENERMKSEVAKEKKNESAIIIHAKQKVIEAEHRCNQVEEKLAEAEQRFTEAKQELDQISNEKNEIEKEIEILQKNLQVVSDELKTNEDETNEIGKILGQDSDGSERTCLTEVKIQVQDLVDKLKVEEGQATNAVERNKALEDKFNSNLEEKDKRISHLEKRVHDIEENLTRKTAECSRLDAELRNAKHRLNEVDSEKQQLERELGSEVTRNRAELAEAQAGRVTQAELYTRSCDEVDDLRKQLDEALNTLGGVRENSVNREVYDQDCARWKGDCAILRSELTDALTKYAQVQLEIANKEQEISDIRVERNQSEARSAKNETEVSSLKSKCHESDVQVNILRQQLTEAKHKVEKAVEENNNLQKSRRDMSLRLTTKQGEMNETERKKVDNLRRQLEHLCKHLQESERRYKDTIAIYRGHLLAAVKGELDNDVLDALQEILKLRIKEDEKGQGSNV